MTRAMQVRRPEDAESVNGTNGDRNASYGLQLAGSGEVGDALARAARWLLPPDRSWPCWTLDFEYAETALAPVLHDELSSDSARLVAAAAQGWIELDRKGRNTRFHAPEAIGPAALVHPYLTSTGAIAGHWLGRTVFHAGAFELDGRVWGVLGGREMGKSSLLMGLHVSGLSVVSDDLVVVDRGHVYSGPRCLDLRAGAAKTFGAGVPLGRLGQRDRWRVDLPVVPGELPLAGWTVLGWSDDFVIEPIDAAGRLAALAANRAVVARGADLQGLLDVAVLPALLFSRPREWSSMGPGIDRLLARLAGM